MVLILKDSHLEHQTAAKLMFVSPYFCLYPPSSFQTDHHYVGEQPGFTHSSLGPYGSHPLHQQLAGDGRLQHHHYRLP